MTLVTKIKRLCETNNISLTQLEINLGFSNMSIRKWDNSNPSFDKIIKVATYFHVTTDYLAGIEDTVVNSVIFNDPVLKKVYNFRHEASELSNKKLDKIIISYINIELEEI